MKNIPRISFWLAAAALVLACTGCATTDEPAATEARTTAMRCTVTTGSNYCRSETGGAGVSIITREELERNPINTIPRQLGKDQ